MSAPGLTTPLRSETFENLQLNAGIFIKNLDYSSTADASALKTAIASAITAGTNILGATRGGGTFVVTRDVREPDADGKRYSYKGGKFVDSCDAKLTTTLIEITADGEISDDQIEDVVRIQEELERISVTVETLQLWSERMLATGAIDREPYQTARANLLKEAE